MYYASSIPANPLLDANTCLLIMNALRGATQMSSSWANPKQGEISVKLNIASKYHAYISHHSKSESKIITQKNVHESIKISFENTHRSHYRKKKKQAETYAIPEKRTEVQRFLLGGFHLSEHCKPVSEVSDATFMSFTPQNITLT